MGASLFRTGMTATGRAVFAPCTYAPNHIRIGVSLVMVNCHKCYARQVSKTLSCIDRRLIASGEWCSCNVVDVLNMDVNTQCYKLKNMGCAKTHRTRHWLNDGSIPLSGIFLYYFTKCFPMAVTLLNVHHRKTNPRHAWHKSNEANNIFSSLHVGLARL